jgi:hypothetical protein
MAIVRGRLSMVLSLLLIPDGALIPVRAYLEV